ncbi:hypothetical protein OIE52_50040 [Streptomyces canus]|uniref:hypothetical protein n=1 Tax=Streptomyces canus TaxID=58343 RepID=UPI002E2857F3|nr:hypothetical protein [Streptomyces canus]
MTDPTPAQQVVVAIPDMGLSKAELADLQEKFRNNIVDSMKDKDAEANVKVSVTVSVAF